MWGKQNKLYNQWRSNLDKADQIDFSQSPPTKKTLTRDIIKDSEFLLNLPQRYWYIKKLRETLNKIEAKRESKNTFWRAAVALKDVLFIISRIPYVLKKKQ